MIAQRTHIAVGTDGSRESTAAIEWAAQRAERMDQELKLLCSDPLAEVMAAVGFVVANPGTSPSAAPERDRELAATLAGLAQRHPDLPVTTEELGGATAGALLAAAAGAELLVMGTRGLGGLGGLLSGGSMANDVLASVDRPLVVVKDTFPDAGAVVLGLEPEPTSREASRFAVAEAASRGSPLVVVSALGYPDMWIEEHLVSTEATRRLQARVREQLMSFVAEDLAAAGDAPLDVTYQVSPTTAPSALSAAAEDAGLVVVGARGRGALTALLLGSTSRRTADSVRCPVALIPNVSAGRASGG